MNTSAATIFLLCCSFHVLILTHGFEENNEKVFLQILKRLLLPSQNESRSEALPNKADDMSNEPEAVMVDQSNGAEANLNIEKKQAPNIYNLQCGTGSRLVSGGEKNIGITPCSCGERCCRNSMEKRIAGNSTEASSDEFPWHAAIYWKKLDGPWEFICGGTLVDKYVVATAAHCIESLINHGREYKRWMNLNDSDQNRLKVTVGSNEQSVNLIDQQGIGVTGFVIHDQFEITEERKAHHYDIALLALAASSDRPVLCLHPSDETAFNMENEPDSSFEGCFGIGFGETGSNEEGEMSATLRKVGTTILSVTACKEKLRSLATVTYQQQLEAGDLNEEYVYAHTCATTNSKTLVACKGDSGSPIVCPLWKRDPCSPYFLAGIFSYKVGPSCGSSFSVLVNTHHTDMIQNNVAPKDWMEDLIDTLHRNEGRKTNLC